jgi:chaperonin GroES
VPQEERLAKPVAAGVEGLDISSGDPTPAEEEEVKIGGIIIPDTAKEKPQEGEVVAVGPGRLPDDGKRIPLEVKAGDRALIGKYAGTREERVERQEPLFLTPEEIRQARRSADVQRRVLEWLGESGILRAQIEFALRNGHGLGRGSQDFYHTHVQVISSGTREGMIFGILGHALEDQPLLQERRNHPNNFNMWTQWSPTGNHPSTYLNTPPPGRDGRDWPGRPLYGGPPLARALKGLPPWGPGLCPPFCLAEDEELHGPFGLFQVDFEVLPEGDSCDENEFELQVTTPDGQTITICYAMQVATGMEGGVRRRPPFGPIY